MPDLPRGLPRLLGEDPDLLNRILGLNRQARLRVVSRIPREARSRIEAEFKAREPSPPPGALDRRLVQWRYADPGFRRAVWENRLLHGPGAVPSFEAEVLADFLEPEPGASPNRASESSGERAKTEKTQRIAERAWSGTRESLARWDSLDEAARERSVLRTFAVATLRNDPGVFAEAVRIAPDLRDQFRGLLPNDRAAAETAEPTAEGEEESYGEDAGEEEPGAVERWTALCRALAELGEAAAGPPPDPASLDEILDEITETVDELRKAAPVVQAELSAELSAAALEELLSLVRHTLDELQADGDFAWLNADIRQRLETRWSARAGSLALAQLEAERARFLPAVLEAREQVHRATKEYEGAGQRIAAKRAERPDGFLALPAWDASLEALQTEERACLARLQTVQYAFLGALSPLGEVFDAAEEPPPSPDSPSPPRTSGTAAGGGEPSPSGDSDERGSEPNGDIPADRDVDRDVDRDADRNADRDAGGESGGEPGEAAANESSGGEELREDAPREPERDAAGETSAQPLPESPPSETDDRLDGRLDGARDREDVQPASARTVSPSPPEELPEPPESQDSPEPTDSLPDPSPSRAEEQICAALLEKPPRLPFAFQAVRLLASAAPSRGEHRARLLEAAALADRLLIEGGSEALASRLSELFQSFPRHDPEWPDAERSFYAAAAFAASLPPALFAPDTGAIAILANLPHTRRFSKLHSLSQRIAAHAAKVQHARTDPALLRAMRSDTERAAAREQCTQEIREWRTNALRRTLLFQPASAVWMRWLDPEGAIGRIIERILSQVATGRSEESDQAAVRASVAAWRDPRKLKELIHRTDREIRGPRRSAERIHTRALEKLVEEAGKAADLVQRHLGLAAPSAGRPDYRVRVFSELRRDLEDSAAAALRELGATGEGGLGWPSAGAGMAAHAIERLRALLDPNCAVAGSKTETDPEELLASGFFRSRILLDSGGGPVGEPREVLESLLGEPSLNELEAIRFHLGQGNLEMARRILDWIGDDRHDELQQALAEAREQEVATLRQQLERLVYRVEQGLMLGSVSADEREKYEPDLAGIRRQLSDSEFWRFGEVRGRLESIESELDRITERHLEQAKRDFDELDLPPDSPQTLAIGRAIEQHDIVTANELVQQVRDNPRFAVPEARGRVVFDEFFPAGAKAIAEELEASHPRAVLESIRQGKKGFGKLTGERRQSAARMLEAWLGLKDRSSLGRDGARQIEQLFSEIGFRGAEVRSFEKDAAMLYTAPLEGKEQSPVPACGSAAKGRYRVICRWNRPTVADLMADARGRGGPPIVLYLGRLSARQRTELAVASRECAATLLILDEMLLVFLCSERGSRLPVLFHCALPFTHVQPYVTTGGLVPPEMFYGRVGEREAVIDPYGPCFLYGGRQLGKTAILRAVEVDAHRPQQGRHVFFVDLKAHGIGAHRDTAYIWPVIWRTLRDGGAIPEDVREPPTAGGRGRIQAFLDALIRHFAPDTERTLLLLLDEADRFLEVDSREQQAGVAATGYRESILMKKLMDDTRRSIKIVFAGLHNVLRTVELANHPLGQFGKPIQVGPLLRNGGMRAAQELLTRPLLAVGYRFRSPDLVTRILAQTNYYPGLIQAYGAELIGTMRSKPRSEPPLHVVDEEILDETYRTGGMRDFIRGRFHLTLDLDKRYEVIAYTIAYRCTLHEEALVHGVSRTEIYREANEWWPKGFAESSPRRFESLLDEMVGLGVLRKVESEGEAEPEGYSLRNPNVLLLMGTKEQIEEKLLEEREPPREFERATFRARRKPDEPEDPSRSPLSFQQEGQLFAEKNGVVLLSGVPAAGFHQVIDVLNGFRGRGKNEIVPIEGTRDRGSFLAELREAVDRQQDGMGVYAVPAEASWAREWQEWIRAAQTYLGRLSKEHRQVRVLFLAEGCSLYSSTLDPAALDSDNRLDLLFLEPWRDGYLRQWMEDVGISDSAGLRGEILEKTGGWPRYVLRFHWLMKKNEGSAEAGLEALESELSDGSRLEEHHRQLCLDDWAMRAVLRPLAAYGGLRRDEVVEEAVEAGIDREEVVRRLSWAERLGLVRSRDVWSIDPVAARLVGEREA